MPHLSASLMPLLFLAWGALVSAPAALAEESCTSAGCHASLLARRTVHAAAETCDGCHEPLGGTHPQPGKRTFKLAAEPPALCANCHDALGSKSQVHAPVREGMCTACHDPHAADQPKLLIAPGGELCASCHGDKTEAAHPHGPVAAGECTTCHLPHEGDVPKLLAKAGDALCFDCHGDIAELLKKPHVHAAVEGGCTSCHDPHGAAQPKLLAESGTALCAGCHEDVAAQAAKAAVPHAALAGEKACAACHQPHAADFPELLAKDERTTCLGCHPGAVTRAMTVLHAPVADGCVACHAPHGGDGRALLTADFPAQPYVPYTDKAYALCFGCHDRDLLRYPDTSFATGFRDGERNLHFLHVNNAQKGRSCKLCHQLHGGANEQLIADNVPFGQWTLPLKWVKTENGGSCAPGCHKPFAYDRKSGAKKP